MAYVSLLRGDVTVGCRAHPSNAHREFLFQSGFGPEPTGGLGLLRREEMEDSMQLVDTHTGNTNDGMMTVEFRGEGGELVSVRMAAGAMKGDAAINRAKAMMVQLTTFAEDRDPAQDEWSRSDGDSEDEGSVLTDNRAELPVVSSGGEATSSAA